MPPATPWEASLVARVGARNSTNVDLTGCQAISLALMAPMRSARWLASRRLSMQVLFIMTKTPHLVSSRSWFCKPLTTLSPGVESPPKVLMPDRNLSLTRLAAILTDAASSALLGRLFCSSDMRGWSSHCTYLTYVQSLLLWSTFITISMP